MKRLFVLSSVMVSLGCGGGVTEVGPPDPSNPLPRAVQAREVDFLKQIETYKSIPNYHDRDRTAKGTCFFWWCPKTSIRIEAVGDTYTIDPKNPPATGRPVAHLVNLGEKVEKHYGLVPNGKGQVDYYFWVDAKSPTQAQWTLLQLSHVTHIVTAALTMDLNYCHKYGEPPPTPTSEADFAQYRPEGSCNVPIAETKAKISQASLVPVSALIALLQHVFVFLQPGIAPSDGAWIYCSNGCCT